MEIKERIERLRAQIKYHSKRYYENDAPEISDFEYDKMFEELKQSSTPLSRNDDYYQEKCVQIFTFIKKSDMIYEYQYVTIISGGI